MLLTAFAAKHSRNLLPSLSVSSSELVVAFSISGNLIKNLVAVQPVIITQRCAHFPLESYFESGLHM